MLGEQRKCAEASENSKTIKPNEVLSTNEVLSNFDSHRLILDDGAELMEWGSNYLAMGVSR